MSSEIDPAKLKVVELRAELGARGLDSKGIKAVLVKRLKDALEKELKKELPDTSIADTSTEDLNISQAEESSADESPHKDEVSVSEDTKLDPKKLPEKMKDGKVEASKTEKNKEVKLEKAGEPAAKKAKMDDTPEKKTNIHTETIKKTKQKEAKENVKEKDVSATDRDEQIDDTTSNEDENEENVDESHEDKSQSETVEEAMETGNELEVKEKKEESSVNDVQQRGDKRKRSVSPSRSQRRRSKSPKEDEPVIDSNKVQLNWYDSDLHLQIDKESFLSGKPYHDGAFGYIWSGARATHGANSGKVCYEVKITEELKWEDFIRQPDRGRRDRERKDTRRDRSERKDKSSDRRKQGDKKDSKHKGKDAQKQSKDSNKNNEKPQTKNEKSSNGSAKDDDKTESSKEEQATEDTKKGEVKETDSETKEEVKEVGETKEKAEQERSEDESKEDKEIKEEKEEEPQEREIEEETKEDAKDEEKKEDHKPEEVKTEQVTKMEVDENETSEKKEEKTDETMELDEAKDDKKADDKEDKKDNKDNKLDKKSKEEKRESKEKELPPIPTHLIRIGWSSLNSGLQLGESKFSYGYESSGKFVSDKQFSEYGKPVAVGDVVGAYLEFSEEAINIKYTVNGEELPVAISIPKSEITDEDFSLFPHVLSRNYAFGVNLGGKDEPFFKHPETLSDYIYVDKFEDKVQGPTRPEARSDCEVIMMCGLPGSGKTHWVKQHVANNPDKRYTVIGNAQLLEKMTVNGNQLKNSLKGRWNVILDKLSKCLNKLVEIAALRRRNYVIDQTNVFPSAQRRKMRPFEGFKRRAVIVVCGDEEQARRRSLQEAQDGKDVPNIAVYEMKANMSLPKVGDWLEEVTYVELDEQQSKTIVQKYNKEGRDNGFGPFSQRRDYRDDRSKWHQNRNQRNDYRGRYRERNYSSPRFDRGSSKPGGWQDRSGSWSRNDRRDSRGSSSRSRDWRNNNRGSSQRQQDRGRDRNSRQNRDSYSRNRNQGSSRSQGGSWQGNAGGAWSSGSSYGGSQGNWQGQTGSGNWNQNYGSGGQGKWNYGSGQGGYGQQQSYGNYPNWNYYGQYQNWGGQVDSSATNWNK